MTGILRRVPFGAWSALAVAAWAALSAWAGRWPSGDGPHVLGASMRLAGMLRAGELDEFGRSLSTLLAPHPPGAYLPWTLAYLVGGPGRSVHLVAAAGLLWLCLDGMKRLGGGAVGALWVLAPALVWAQAEGGGVDQVAAACAAQAVSHLAASDRLRDPRAAALWGAWMGAGFLAKYTSPMFLWAPCLLAGWWTVRERRWRALAIAVAAFAVVAGPWMALRGASVVAYVASSVAPDPFLVAATDLSTGPWWGFENLGWDPAAGLDAWGWAGALALVAGLVGRPRRDAPREARALALLAVAGAWVVLAQNVQRQDRYMLPAVPLVAAVAGATRRRAWLAPVAAAGLCATAWTFATAEDAPPERDFGHTLRGAGGAWPWPAEAYSPVSQDPAGWEVDRAVAALREAHGGSAGTVGLLLDDERGAPGMGLFLYRSATLGARWHLASVAVRSLPGNTGGIRSMTFVGPFATDIWPARDFTALYAQLVPGDPAREAWLAESGMTLVSSWPLPRGYEGRVYANNN